MNIFSSSGRYCDFLINCGLIIGPEVFSLEEDAYGDMFITQESSQIGDSLGKEDKVEDEDGLFLGLSQSNFSSPCVSFVSQSSNNAMYPDISDAEDFEKNENSSTQNM